VITDSEVATGPCACEPYREAIELGLSRGRNARAIWPDLVSEYGFASSCQSVQRFVRKRRGAQVPEARVVIVTAPGDPQSGKYLRTRLFVMTLGCSRKSVRLLTFRSSSRFWAELHEKAFRRLGGASRIVVLDNLREGVLVPDIYDPTLNPSTAMCSPTTARSPWHSYLLAQKSSGVRLLAGIRSGPSDLLQSSQIAELRRASYYYRMSALHATPRRLAFADMQDAHLPSSLRDTLRERLYRFRDKFQPCRCPFRGNSMVE
jgi:hypothetical protein